MNKPRRLQNREYPDGTGHRAQRTLRNLQNDENASTPPGLDNDLVRRVRASPLESVLIAAGVGFTLGFLGRN